MRCRSVNGVQMPYDVDHAGGLGDCWKKDDERNNSLLMYLQQLLSMVLMRSKG